MFLKEFRNHFNKELLAVFPQTEIDSFFFLLIEKELGLQRIDVALNNQVSISEDTFKHLYNSLSRLKNQEPIQYILGETEKEISVIKDAVLLVQQYKNKQLEARALKLLGNAYSETSDYDKQLNSYLKFNI